MSSAWAFRLWRKVSRGPIKLQWDRRNDHMLLPQLNKLRLQSRSGRDHLHPAYGYRWISTQIRWKEERNTSARRARSRIHLGWRMWTVSVVMAMMHGFATCCHSNQKKKSGFICSSKAARTYPSSAPNPYQRNKPAVAKIIIPVAWSINTTTTA